MNFCFLDSKCETSIFPFLQLYTRFLTEKVGFECIGQLQDDFLSKSTLGSFPLPVASTELISINTHFYVAMCVVKKCIYVVPSPFGVWGVLQFIKL